jgi:hypothetical protein
MSENIDNIIIEHLKSLRNEIKEFRSETREELQIIKMRINSLERGQAGSHDDSVILQTRLDRVDGRIDRIEKRLELTAA